MSKGHGTTSQTGQQFKKNRKQAVQDYRKRAAKEAVQAMWFDRLALTISIIAFGLAMASVYISLNHSH